MNRPACAVCGQPATVHETSIENGSAVTRHLCETHGAAAIPTPARTDPARLPELAAWFDGLSDQEKADLAEQHRLTRRGG